MAKFFTGMDLPKLSNEDQLWIMAQVRDNNMTIDEALEVVKEKSLESQQTAATSPAPMSPAKVQQPHVSALKKKGSIHTHFFGEGRVKDIPADSISAPIIPIDASGNVQPTVTFDQTFQDIRKKGDEERLKILDLVKSGQMTIDDALKYADDAGLSSSAQKEDDTIADTTSAILEQKVYNFPVYKAGKVRAQVRRILQIDFKNKNIGIIQRGNVVKKYTFCQTNGYETDEGVHFTLLFADDHDLDYDADSQEERYEICRLISIILKLNKADIRNYLPSEQDYWRELPKLQVILKEGELEKKGGGAFTVWTKRWVRVRRGECSYYRPGEQTALNILQLAEGTTAITKVDESGFILIGKVKQYAFRIPAGERSLDQQRWERDQWIKIILEASHNEVSKPSASLDFVRYDDITSGTESPPGEREAISPSAGGYAAPAHPIYVQQLCEALESLRAELSECSVTTTVLTQVDHLVGMVNRIETTPLDYKRPSRFIPPEADIARLAQTVDEKIRRRTPQPDQYDDRQHYAQTSVDTILKNQGIDPESESKAPQAELLPELIDEPPPDLPVKRNTILIQHHDRTESNVSSSSSLTDKLRSSACNDSGGYSTPSGALEVDPSKSSGNSPSDMIEEETPVAKPRRKTTIKQETSFDIGPQETEQKEPMDIEESSPPRVEITKPGDDSSENNTNDSLLKSSPLPSPITELPTDEPGSMKTLIIDSQPSTKGRTTSKSRSSSTASDTSDGRVTDAAKHFEELAKEFDEEIPHKLSVSETRDATVIIFAPPPAPLLPPPAPALPGLGPFNNAKKIKRPAQCKLKAFHWDKVPKNLYNKSLWKRASDLTDQLDVTILDEMFAEDRITASKSGQVTSAVPERKTRSLLDAKRSQNLSIVLAGLKMDVEELQKKLNLIRAEDMALPIEQVGMLRRLQPTPDDIEMYRAYKGDVKDLDRADRFLIELCDIPQLGTRLDLLYDIMELPSQYQELEPSVQNLDLACQELLESKSFTRVLEYVLAVGNYINSGAGKPAVDGFQLSSLKKLSDSKGKDKKFTLLHYLVQFLIKKQPDLLHFYDGLSHVHHCTELSIAGLSAEVEVMKRYVTKIQKNAKNLKKSRSNALEIKFQQDVQVFVTEYDKLLKQLNNQCNDVSVRFKKAMEFYGEPTDRNSEEIFPALAEFLVKFKSLVREEEKKQQMPAKALANVFMKGMQPNPASLKGIQPSQASLKKVVSSTGSSPVLNRSNSTTNMSERPTKDGYLEKLSGGKHRNAKWDKRFFEISATGYLHYFRKQFDKNLGSVYLIGCAVTMETDDASVICIDTEDRDFKLRAKSISEAEEWFTALIYYGDKK